MKAERPPRPKREKKPTDPRGVAVTIEKMVYGGEGLARLPGDGAAKALFVPFVLPHEQVRATIIEEKPGFARAALDEVVKSAAERVKPDCPYFARCGGCHYQHAPYERQLELKRDILRETLRRIAKLDWPGEINTHPSPPWNYRNRTRMRLRAEPFAIGYYRYGTHELLPVEQCPISSPLLNRAIEALWKLGKAGKVPPASTEIEFFANDRDDKMLVELTGTFDKEHHKAVAKFAVDLRAALPVVGVAVFVQRADGAMVRSDWNDKEFGASELEYQAGEYLYHVSAGSFFQTNRFLTQTLVEIVTTGMAGATALDLYAGTGLFALPLSQDFIEVSAVESAPFSFHDLQRNVPSNVASYRHTVEDFLQNLPDGANYDLVVVDPPRAGLSSGVAERLGKLAAGRLTYVSCDPATLSRDLRLLLESGYRVQEVHLVDLFPQTFHLENVVHLAR